MNVSFQFFKPSLTVLMPAGPFECPSALRPDFLLVASRSTSAPLNLFAPHQALKCLHFVVLSRHWFTRHFPHLLHWRQNLTLVNPHALSHGLENVTGASNPGSKWVRYRFWHYSSRTRMSVFLGNVHSIEKEISVNHPILQQLWRRKLAAEEQVRLCICLLKAALTGIQKRTRAPAHRHTLLTCDLLTPDSLLLKSVKSHHSKTKVCRRSRWITRRLRVKKKMDFSKMFGGAWQQSQLNKSPNSPLQQNSYRAYLCTSTVL